MTIVLVAGALLIGILGGYVASLAGRTSRSVPSSVDGFGPSAGMMYGVGRNGDDCLSDDCLSVDGLNYPVGSLSEEVESALNQALEDEYKAFSTYEKVVGKLGMVRPFSMIIRAEESHIAAIRSLFDKYGLNVPENMSGNAIQSPFTLQEACRVGVIAERANISLYEDKLLLAVRGHKDIEAVFTNLMNASRQKHLPAFERCD